MWEQKFLRFPKAASHLLPKEGSALGAKLLCAISYIFNCQVSLIGSTMIAVWSYSNSMELSGSGIHAASLLSGDWVWEGMRLLCLLYFSMEAEGVKICCRIYRGKFRGL